LDSVDVVGTCECNVDPQVASCRAARHHVLSAGLSDRMEGRRRSYDDGDSNEWGGGATTCGVGVRHSVSAALSDRMEGRRRYDV